MGLPSSGFRLTLFIYLFIYLWIPQRLVYSINLSRGRSHDRLGAGFTWGAELTWGGVGLTWGWDSRGGGVNRVQVAQVSSTMCT